MASSARRAIYDTLPYYIEKYVLSAFFLAAAGNAAVGLIAGLRASWELQPDGGAVALWTYVGTAYLLSHHLLLVVFNGLVGLTLLRSQKPRVGPESPKEIIIPLFATFSSLAYSFVGVLPHFLIVNHAPRSWWPVLTIACGVLTVAGLTLTITALLHLKRSFGIVVQVREVVRKGPYAYIRHPMYAGYLLLMLSLVLTRFCFANMLLYALQLALIIYRARLEEAKLLRYDPDYAQVMQRAGLLFPRLWRKRCAAAVMPVAAPPAT